MFWLDLAIVEICNDEKWETNANQKGNYYLLE